MNIVDFLATTCGLKVRSYRGSFSNHEVPSIIIGSTDWGSLIQSLIDHAAAINDDYVLKLRVQQFLQQLRTAPLGFSQTVIYPNWFPMTHAERESLIDQDMLDSPEDDDE